MLQSERNNLNNSFEKTLKDSNLQSLVSNSAEILIDNVLKDGLLKEVPVVSTITGFMKLGANIQDRLFLKKIISFLQSLSKVPTETRKDMIEKIDESERYRVRVGEKLLYIIDKSDDYEISELISKVFKYFLEENITYDDFLKTAVVINNLTIPDFNWFTKERDSYYFDLSNVGDMISTGLFELYYEDIQVSLFENGTNEYERIKFNNRKNDFKRGNKQYETEVDGGVSVYLSRAGEIILEVFCPNYEKKKKIKI
ncbi:MAG: hypothetical protein WD512_05835 [Candidatus Paceibacterota bacterium]